jgi:predicted dehydrogenase
VLASEHLDLKAVYSRSLRSAEDTAKASGKQVELYSEDSKQGYKDVLNREDVDAVIIA